MLLNISLIFLILLSNVHPFHVSVCEIYHNPDTFSLEISMKIFIDDMELAVQKSEQSDFKLADIPEKNVDNEQLYDYLKKHFSISVDKKEINLEFVGFEFDEDAVLCYLEGKKIKKINSVEISNTLLTEVFDDQINLTHFQYKDEMKSIKTVKDQPSGLIDTSGW